MRYSRKFSALALVAAGLGQGAAWATLPDWGVNLLSNPGFEAPANLGGWSPFSTATLALATDAHEGTQSVSITGRTYNYSGVGANLLGQLTAGVTYEFTAWVKATGTGSNSTLTLNLKKVDGAGTQYVTLDNLTGIAPNKWTKLFGRYTYQPTGTVTSLTYYVNGPAAGVNMVVDELAVRPPVSYTPTGGPDTDYLHASGHDLVVDDPARTVQMIGANFIAYGDDTETADVVLKSKNFDENDYVQLGLAGLNSVRLNAWYKLFEDDAAPYVYKQSGWDWLNKQIIWAKRAGVRIVLDMHAPQCGSFQGPNYAGLFWTDTTCQARLQALWVEIANRYKDEPVIASFDLLNEPNPTSQAQWTAYAQSLIDAIRAVDSRHLIQVENCFAADCDGPVLVNDSNVIYDFHDYEPWKAAGQLSYNTGYGDSNMTYGDPTIRPFEDWEINVGALSENSPIPTGTTAWTWYDGPLFTVNDPTVAGAMPVLVSTGNTGKVTLDDFVVREYDPNGALVRTIQNIDIEKKPTTWYLLENYDPFLSFTGDTTTQRLSGATGSRVIETTGHRGTASVSISNANGKYLVKMPKLTFAVRQGYKYQISGWLKGTSATGSTGNLGLQWQTFKSWVVPTPYTQLDYLEPRLLDAGVQFSLDNNVPVNIGEFGQSVNAFNTALNAQGWVDDTLDLMAQHGVSGHYFNWHGTAFGIYRNLYGFPDPTALNQPLLNALGAAGTAAGSLALP